MTALEWRWSISVPDEALADRIEVAVTRNDRRKGLLGRDVFETSSALIIAPCFSIHTMFMRFDIDAVFVDDDGRAVKVVQGMGPWRIAVQPFAHAVVELPAGSLRERPVDVGDRLYLREQQRCSASGCRPPTSGTPVLTPRAQKPEIAGQQYAVVLVNEDQLSQLIKRPGCAR